MKSERRGSIVYLGQKVHVEHCMPNIYVLYGTQYSTLRSVGTETILLHGTVHLCTVPFKNVIKNKQKTEGDRKYPYNTLPTA